MKEKIVLFFTQLAKEMGEIALKYYKKLDQTQIQNKTVGADDPVTIADLEISKHVQQRIQETFGEDVVLLSEESIENFKQTEKPMIIIDELDGTKAYRDGKDTFCHLLCYYDKEPLVSVLYNPVSQELIHAVKGGGAYLNGERIYCSSESHFDAQTKMHVIVSSNTAYNEQHAQYFAEVSLLYDKISYSGKGVRESFGTQCISVLTQREDGTICSRLSNWDCAACYLAIKEAGGHFFILQGSLFNPIEWSLQDTFAKYPVLVTNGSFDESFWKFCSVHIMLNYFDCSNVDNFFF